MDKGVYCLVFKNPSCCLTIGGIGPRVFGEGWHVYVGSALGSGGLKRVCRHIRLSRERDRVPRWHVDRLLLSDRFALEAVVCARTEAAVECALASALGGPYIPGFGSSDCRCPSHLLFRDHPPVAGIIRTMAALGLVGTSTTIK
jgi:Uri superfamily endonuclease